jgi:hypothetical protein
MDYPADLVEVVHNMPVMDQVVLVQAAKVITVVQEVKVILQVVAVVALVQEAVLQVRMQDPGVVDRLVPLPVHPHIMQVEVEVEKIPTLLTVQLEQVEMEAGVKVVEMLMQVV